MKKILCLIISCILLLGIVGCTQNSKNIEVPVLFYYRTSYDDYASTRKVLTPEIRESAPYSGDIIGLLSLYLQGPESSTILNPFPNSTTVLDFELSQNAATITLSSHFSRLSGMDLSIACACLSMTVMEYTGCDQVTIIAANSTLGPDGSVVICRNDLLLDYF